MEDHKIIELYWARSQQAIQESEDKYGPYCRSIARGILDREEDAEECVNDTWFRAWNAMPPQRPNILSAFFGKLTRNLSLDRWRKERAEGAGGQAGRQPGGGGPPRAGGLSARPPPPRRGTGGQ